MRKYVLGKDKELNEFSRFNNNLVHNNWFISLYFNEGRERQHYQQNIQHRFGLVWFVIKFQLRLSRRILQINNHVLEIYTL